MSPRSRIVDRAAWAQLAWLALVVIVWSAVLSTLRLDPDYTAGALLDHLAAWRAGHALYPTLGAEPPFRVLNYPPLVFVLARGLTALGLPDLAAGRLVNGLGLLLLVAAVAWWARARGARGAALAGTVGLLGASFPLLYAAGQFHIELWGEAGTVWGFALLDRGRLRSAPALAGLALAAGCFAKQTQAVPALIALAWVWTHRREAAPLATAAFGLGGLLGAAAVTGTWGVEAWRHMVVYTVGTLSAANLGRQMASHALPWIVLLAFALRERWAAGRRGKGDAVWWYWAGALAWSLSAARRGSGYPYFLDLQLATVVWVGPRIFGAPKPSRAWSWLLAVQVVLADAGVAAAATVNVARLEAVQAHLPELCARLEGHGPVLAEEPGLVRACGHAAVLDPFIMASLARQGLWDAAPFERSIGQGALDLAVLPFDPRAPVDGVHAERWTPAALQAFRSAPEVHAGPAGEWIVRW